MEYRHAAFKRHLSTDKRLYIFVYAVNVLCLHACIISTNSSLSVVLYIILLEIQLRSKQRK